MRDSLQDFVVRINFQRIRKLVFENDALIFQSEMFY